MPENITILEGGKAENFGQIAKLRTSNSDGGYDLWVPEKDVKTSHLSVKKNGLYYTNEYTPTKSEKKDKKSHHSNIYGWDTVTVSVKKKIKGKKKKTNPDTGLEYDVPTTVEVDDDGNLVEKELPTSIKITKKPKTNYVDDQKITIEGIVVHGYLEDGTDWGEVPFDELSFEPAVAEIGDDNIYVKGEIKCCAVEVRTPYSGAYSYGYISSSPLGKSGDTFFFATANSPITLYITTFEYDGRVVGAYTTDSETKCYGYDALNSDGSGGFGGEPIMSGTGGTKYIFNGYGYVGNNLSYLNIPMSSINPIGQSFEGAEKQGSKQEVTVTWNNEDLDDPLTDKYEIEVSSKPSEGSDEGGTGGTGGGGTGGGGGGSW